MILRVCLFQILVSGMSFLLVGEDGRMCDGVGGGGHVTPLSPRSLCFLLLVD